MSDPRADDDLMLAFAAGESEAFDALYERYRKPIYRYLFHAVGNRATADDLYQDVWSRIIDARERFRRGNGFKRWAFRIAHNRLVDHWRVLGRRPAPGDDDVDALPGDAADAPDAALARGQDAERLRAALMRLPNEQREAFLLQQEAGLTLADIAERGGVGRETVKSRLRYATAKLRNLLAPGPEATGK
ncbi:MAG: sigma-70 family RNA polymerase sigma factor [Candidatus Wenzhouxiangella sp. M2_3B_020]